MNPKKPVIFVIFQTSNRANGGVESITQIISRLGQVHPVIVTQFETQVNKRWRQAGADVRIWELPYRVGTSFYRSKLVGKLRRVKSWLSTNYQMARLVSETGSRVIHCNDGYGFWHTAFGARSKGASVVLNVRDVKAPDQTYGWHWNIIFGLSQRVVVLSRQMQHALQERFSLLEKKLSYIYSIVDFTQMHPVSSDERQRLRSELGIAKQEIAIGYVAAFSPKKAQLEFIENAGPSLKSNLPTSRIHFLGDFNLEENEYARACDDAVQRLELTEQTHFAGYTERIADWYRALDLVLIASRHEGLARCMIESLACGTPVISFDVTSAREILEQYQCGRVVSQGDYAALADEISYLASDRSERLSLGQKGARIARTLFDAEDIVHQYEALYGS